MLQILASLNDNSVGVINDHNMFIVQTTGVIVLKVGAAISRKIGGADIFNKWALACKSKVWLKPPSNPGFHMR